MRLRTRLKGVAWLFARGLPILLAAKRAGRETRWWRYRFMRLVFDRGLLLRNVLGRVEPQGARRALLCYLVPPFLAEPGSAEMLKHGNRWRSLELARLLDELGFVVDVMDHDDERTQVRERYDLLLGQGAAAHKLASRFGARTRKLYLGTAPAPGERDGCVRARTAAVNRARGCAIPLNRTADEFDPGLLGCWDALACLGGDEATTSYRPHFRGPIYTWHNHAHDRFVGEPEKKDFESARRHFLFFGTRSQILCGLDLALETFARRPHLELWVCGPFADEPAFERCFAAELHHRSNIHPVGWVQVGGDRFTDLCRRCGFVIAPMCPTFSHGSLVVCAGAGLVPVATPHAAGVDTDRLETTLPSLELEAIGNVVDRGAARPAAWLRARSAELVETVGADFSQAAFGRRFQAILEEVVGG